MTTEHSGSGDLDRSLALLWDIQERPARGPKPSLTLDAIVTAAVTVADAEGMSGLSMRRVALELGVGTMSLYRYVPGKAELLDLMLDQVSGPSTELENSVDAGWRQVLELLARGTWQLCIAHPWLLQVDQARPLLGPNGLASMELIMHGLAECGLSDPEKTMVIEIVNSYSIGVARAHVNSLQAEERTGLSDDEFWKAQEPVLIEAMESGRYPTMAALSDDTFAASYEETFEFGLERLLNGLEAYISSLGGTESDPSPTAEDSSG